MEPLPRGVQLPPPFQVPRDLPEPFLISSGAWFPQPEVRIRPPARFAPLLPSVHPHHGGRLPAGVRRRLEAPGGSAGSPLASPTLGTACRPPGWRGNSSSRDNAGPPHGGKESCVARPLSFSILPEKHIWGKSCDLVFFFLECSQSWAQVWGHFPARPVQTLAAPGKSANAKHEGWGASHRNSQPSAGFCTILGSPGLAVPSQKPR